MKQNKFSPIWIVILLTILFSPRAAKGQITPDNSLGNENSTFTDSSGLIEGGARRGGNLFHSFQEFNIREAQQVNFVNPNGIAHIFTRITGNNPSAILGTIGVNGPANLYLLNPNGILFGPNAKLDIQGSFLATTADRIVFSDGSLFSSRSNEQNSPLLTINVPIGLDFSNALGSIINNSQQPGQEIFYDNGINRTRIPGGLQVSTNQTIALIGGDILIQEGSITTQGGQIELGSVGNNSRVGIVLTEQDFAFNYESVETFKDITLDSANLITQGDSTGNLQLQGRNITVGNSIILSQAKAGNSGNLILKASDLINIFGVSGTTTAVEVRHDAGENNFNSTLSVTGREIRLDGGTQILSNNYTDTPGTNIIIEASEQIEIKGTGVIFDSSLPDGSFSYPSAIFAATEGNGSAGNITINTERLVLKDVGQISSSTFGGTGRGGDVFINASQSLELSGSFVDSFNIERLSGIFAQVEPDSEGDAGNITIRTGSLIVLEGAQISTSTLSVGQGGDIDIEAQNLIRLSGTSPNANLEVGSSGIFVSAEKAYLNNSEEVVNTTGNAGNLLIKTPELIIEDGARISGDTFGLGKGGNIQINVDSLIIKDGGTLRAGSLIEQNPLLESDERGDGGSLTINASEFIELTGTGTVGDVDPIPVVSRITTESQGTGKAGDLNISTQQLTVAEGAEITASTSSFGAGGNISISSHFINLNQGAISASSISSGNAGNITIRVKNTLNSNNSTISTSAEQASGGSITISAQDIRNRGNSDIRTNVARGTGGGGDITLTADSILAFNDSDILAFAQDGIGGNITLNTPVFFGNGYQATDQVNQNPDNLDNNDRVDINASGAVSGVISIPDLTFIQNSLFELPETLINTENLIASSCVVPNQQKAGTFILTGPEGLPTRPNNNTTSPYPTGTVETIPEQSTPKIQEPQGFYRLPNGQMVLSRKCH